MIERGLTTFVEVGMAPIATKTDKLYKDTGYTTFEEYCQERWHMGRNYANKVIIAASTAGLLKAGSSRVRVGLGESCERSDLPDGCLGRALSMCS